MEFAMEEIGDVVVVKPSEEVLDANNSSEFKKDISPLLESKARIVFDMSTMRFIDSSGCGVLLSCLRNLKARDGDLKLFGLSKQVRSLFQIIRLDQILDAYDTREAAIEAFRDPGA